MSPTHAASKTRQCTLFQPHCHWQPCLPPPRHNRPPSPSHCVSPLAPSPHVHGRWRDPDCNSKHTFIGTKRQQPQVPLATWPPTRRTCGYCYAICTLTSHSEQLVATAMPSLPWPPTQSNLCQILATELLAATIISLTITSGPHTYFTHMNANTYTHWDKPESNVIVIQSILKLTDMCETVSQLFMKPSIILCL